MVNRWTGICRLSGDASLLLIECQEKFPDIKFKLDEPKDGVFHLFGLLPSPHPNPTAKEVFLFVAGKMNNV